MSYNTFIPIVTDGLIIYIDVANPKSYPGSGTTIYDLSGNNNHGTLYNGVGYSQSNGGVLTFDGVNDYIGTVGPDLSSNNYTVIGASRYSGGIRKRVISSWYGLNFSNWLLGHWENSTENYFAEGFVSSLYAGPSDTNWRIYAGTGDITGDLYSFYVNGLLNAGPNGSGSGGPNSFAIGSYGIGPSNPSGGEWSTGEFSFLMAYNRVLTPEEILQNYNATKWRFQ